MVTNNEKMEWYDNLPFKEKKRLCHLHNTKSCYEIYNLEHKLQLKEVEKWDWKYKDLPKNGTKIIRWHQIWKCPVAVFYCKTDPVFPWTQSAGGTVWSEESFTPDAWYEYPEAPLPK